MHALHILHIGDISPPESLRAKYYSNVWTSKRSINPFFQQPHLNSGLPQGNNSPFLYPKLLISLRISLVKLLCFLILKFQTSYFLLDSFAKKLMRSRNRDQKGRRSRGKAHRISVTCLERGGIFFSLKIISYFSELPNHLLLRKKLVLWKSPKNRQKLHSNIALRLEFLQLNFQKSIAFRWSRSTMWTAISLCSRCPTKFSLKSLL